MADTARRAASVIARRPSIPARWRIVGLILLTTTFALIAVGATVRMLFLHDVDRAANRDVVQELDEFRAFAAEGVDPTTTRPFTSVDRLLSVFLARQRPSQGEELIGLTDDRVLPFDRSGEPDSGLPHDLSADIELLNQIRDSEAASGVIDTPGGPMRWGRADIDAGTQSGALVVAVFTGEARAVVNNAIRTTAFVAGGGLLLTAGIAWLVAGQILAPVRAVREVAADIGENDLTARVPVHGRDDIAALAETFNAMLDRIEHAYITQRRFVDDASHELRTPITVIRGHLELMGTDPQEQAQTLRLVDEELARMGRIVSDLLTMAKADRPDFVQPSPVSVAELTLDIEAKAHALGDRQWLLMQVAEGEAVIDAQRITQAVLQLATNAVQYTHPGDAIRLGSAFSGAGDERRLSLWISDTGPGIRADETATIFSRFQHGSAHARPSDPDRPTVERGGAGLGLSIVQAIARAHGGSAWVRSVFGEGATFGLDLPAPHTAATAAPHGHGVWPTHRNPRGRGHSGPAAESPDNAVTEPIILPPNTDVTDRSGGLG
ncbi:MAG TPA: HAMP domain-containing sensor histidine kinase [Aldersonia sp.]